MNPVMIPWIRWGVQDPGEVRAIVQEGVAR